MIPNTELYKSLKEETERLKSETLTDVDFYFILGELISTEAREKALSDILADMEQKKIDAKHLFIIGLFNHPDFFTNENVTLHLSKTLGVMEISESWEDFETKKKKPKKEEKGTDYDKIIKAILSVPKPDKKEKKQL